MAYTQDDVRKATNNLTGVTIPVHVTVDAQQVVLAQPEMKELLASAEAIAVGACACRESERNCDNPIEVCLALDSEARERITDRQWREVSLEEALELLEDTYRLGLVHMAYRRGDASIGFACSCCTCCCWPLTALQRFDYHDAITESAFVADYDEAKCIGCGTCVERCPFDAFSLPNAPGTASFSRAKCFGCGLCVSTCPSGAISFAPRASAEVHG